MAKRKKTLRWHPAFYAGMQIELQEDAGRLEFRAEHTLGSEPVRADLLIIKKTDGRPLRKRIGKIFRTHNIVEYKSPGHSLTIDAFYKACGYVNLYKAVTGGADEIKITDMTLTFVCSRYPGKLIRHLEKVRGYSVSEDAPGVCYVNGDIIPIQIILINKLPEEESRWLRSLTDRMTEKGEISRLLENYEGHKEDPLYRTVMDLVVRANWEKFEEVRTEMCDALVELMEDYINERMESERSRMKSEYSRMESERSRLESERSRMESERSQMESERSRMESERSQMESERSQMESERSRMESEYSKEIDNQREAGIKSVVEVCRNLKISREVAAAQLAEQYRLTEECAEGYMEKYWKE